MVRKRPRPSRRAVLAGLAMLVGGAVALPPAASAEEFPFRDGEVIRLIVPYGPGGGFDRVLRLIRPHFEAALNELSGDRSVTVLVENMPGAGGRVSYEYVYNSPPDGTTLLLLGDQGAALQQVALGADFDLDRFSYIAVVNNSDWGLLVAKDTGIASMQDLIKRANETPILFATTGAGSNDHITLIVLQAMLQEAGLELPIDYAHFSGAATAFASMQRGEAEAYIGSVESTLPAVNEGYANIVSVFSDQRSGYFPDAQTTVEEAIPGAERFNAATGVSRVIAGPPDLPENVLSTLRQAAAKALRDPSLLEAAERARLPVEYASGEEAKAIVARHSMALIEFKDLVKAVVE